MFRAIDHFDIQQAQNERREYERKKWFIAARNNKEQKELRQDRLDEAIDEFATSIILAETFELQEFEVELDTYDALTIEAIQDNLLILDRLYKERDAMLKNAYILEDGTRVFKSEDGQRVYDEHGQIVSSDIVQPDAIADHYPKAEPYLDKLKLINKYEGIAERLAEYQEKLDQARERMDSGEMTKDELKEYRQELQQTMPIEVRRKLPDYDPSQETDLKSDFAKTASATAELGAKISPADMAIDASMVLTQ